MTENFEGQNKVQEKKKGMFKRFAEMLKSAFGAFIDAFDFFSSNYKNTKWGSYISVCVCVGFIAARTLYENLSHTAILAVLLWIFILALACVLVYLGERLVKVLFRFNVLFVYYWILLFLLMKNGVYSGCLKSVRTPSLILVGISSFAILVFANGLFSIIKNKNRSKFVISVTSVFALLSVFYLVFIFGEGFSESETEDYLLLDQLENVSIVSVEDAISIDGRTMGPYETKVIEYGTDSFPGEEIDLSAYASDADGLRGFYRTKFLKMDLEHAMIQGMAWYPEDASDCPILFIMHGNHTTNETSHDGYDYLGEYLSSYGYVVVSIDENILNTLSGENDARAIFFLEHMKVIRDYTLDETNPLYQKGDFSNIAIAGHSRGGESAALAYLFNDLERYTENAVRKLNFDFDIQSIIAIAPSVNQFTPADHPVEIEDVNYLLIQGANDHDIYGYMGMTQYENVTFSGEEDCFKSAFYILDANHGQFNTKWGSYDLQFPYSQWINVKNLLPEEEQEQIAKTLIKTFLDDTLLGDKTHHTIFEDYRSYTEILAETIYITQYQSSKQLIICDFEEDSDLTTGSLDGTKVQAYHVGVWGEKTENYSNKGLSKADRQNHILNLKWTEKTDPYVEFVFPKQDVRGGILTFSIADADLRMVEEEDYQLLECKVILKDEYGKEASIITRDYASLYPPLPVKLGKMQYLVRDFEYKIQLQTVRIPVEDFNLDEEIIDFESIVEIEIHILNRESGEIHLDKIGIEK